MILTRKDPLAFRQYDGFSGSPVLNSFGSVVGVVVVQYNDVLGAFSINSLSDVLVRHGIAYSDQWELEDVSLMGLGRCQELLEKSITYAGSRYSKELHQSDPNIEEYIGRFIHYESYATWETKITEIENWVKNRQSTVANSLFSEYKHGDYYELAYYLENCNEEKVNEGDLIAKQEKRIAKEYLSRLNQHYESYVISSQHVLLLTGKAGVGKTHTVCQIAESLCTKTNVYLTFGSQYDVMTDAMQQLCLLSGFALQDLQNLDERMNQRQRFAFFIIDALNEGAGDSYWQTQINILIHQFANYRNLKLILTVRDPVNEIIFNGVENDSYITYPINGFYDSKKAVEFFLIVMEFP